MRCFFYLRKQKNHLIRLTSMILKKLKTLSLIGLITVSCSPISYRADKHLNDEEKTKVIAKIIRYLGNIPSGANYETRFDEAYDDHYNLEREHYELIHFYPKKNTYYIYFSVIRKASGIDEKYVGTAGKFRYEKGTVKMYEDVFQTWKMEKTELLEKLDMLFERMIYGRDLKPYYPENSDGDQFIEFPNERVSFNKKKAIWESSNNNALNPSNNQLHSETKDSADSN